MAGSATSSFVDPECYRAEMRELAMELVVTRPGPFHARLTRVTLRNLTLLNLEECCPRVAAVTLPPHRAFITFPMRVDDLALWNGTELRPGDLVLHSLGERFHQRMTAGSAWGFICMAPLALRTFSRTLAGHALVPPPFGYILHASPPDWSRLKRLIAQAVRLAQTRPLIIGNPTAATALEQELIGALINCLTEGEAERPSDTRREHARIMSRLEDVLAAHPTEKLRLDEVCSMIGVASRMLAGCCERFLGLGPMRYLRLRRLKLVRNAILSADAHSAGIAELARKHGFREAGRFAVDYRTAFGETPSTTRRRRFGTGSRGNAGSA